MSIQGVTGASEPRGRLTVEQYHALIAQGRLHSGEPVELLEGLLVDKMTKNPPHRIATRRVRLALERIVGAGWYVDTQEPIVTADSEPEPDVAVIRGRSEDYRDENPNAFRKTAYQSKRARPQAVVIISLPNNSANTT